MWFQIVTLFLFYLQANSYARSIESSALDKLISSSIQNHRPVIIIVNPSKSLGLDFNNDDNAYDRYKDKNDLFSGALRASDTKSCKQFLRQELKGKCSGEAECSEVVWKLAKEVCDGDESTRESDEVKQEINEVKKKTEAPKKEDVKVYILMKHQ
ncbi:uncharacterized protein LOC133523051 [Cydia pomonella]|uniref:uncharacterized protein LOC133523051 n=1 Tax=Cydia pomonella TaxID=82600 RepID=UPI002ADE7FCD|nr:uncharacterized protein LOC133523051 [Cydia pomonella]